MADVKQDAEVQAAEGAPDDKTRIKVDNHRPPVWLLLIWVAFFVWMIVYALKNIVPAFE